MRALSDDDCPTCDDPEPWLCDGCGDCQTCCNCTPSDCDCDACVDRRAVECE